MKTIYLILSHTLARTGLRMCLTAEASLQVLGDTGNATTGWQEVTSLDPDILLVDEPSLAALHASGALPMNADKASKLQVALFTAPSGMDEVDAAIRIGVRGFIDASSSPEVLIKALVRIADGDRFVSPSLLPNFDPVELAAENSAIIPEDRLSTREMEVFSLTAEGLEAKEIGDRLGISPRTVDVHRANMRQKLELVGVHELIRFAITWRRDRQRTKREGRFCNQSRPLLMIENDEVDILSVERALARLGTRFPIESKRNGEDALAWLRDPAARRPFMILLDINMPRMDGHEFLTELRKDAALRIIPVIVFTTSTLESDRSRMYETGITGFLVKPTRTEEFAQMFRSLAEFWGQNTPPTYTNVGGQAEEEAVVTPVICEAAPLAQRSLNGYGMPAGASRL